MINFQPHRYFLSILVQKKKHQLFLFFLIGFIIYLFCFSILSTAIELRNNEYYETIPKEPHVTINAIYPLASLERQLLKLENLRDVETSLGVSFTAFFEIQFNQSKHKVIVVLVSTSTIENSNQTFSFPFQGTTINVSSKTFQDGILRSKFEGMQIVSYSDIKEYMDLNATNIIVTVFLTYTPYNLDKSLFSLTDWIEQNIEMTIVQLEEEKFTVFVYKSLFKDQEKFLMKFNLTLLSFLAVLFVMLSIVFITLSVEIERFFSSLENILTIFDYRGKHGKGLMILLEILVIFPLIIGLEMGIQFLGTNSIERKEIGIISLGFVIFFGLGFSSSELKKDIWFVRHAWKEFILLYFSFAALIYTIDSMIGRKLILIGFFVVFIFFVDKMLFMILDYLINDTENQDNKKVFNVVGLEIFRKSFTKREIKRLLLLIILILISLNGLYPMINSEQIGENQWGTLTLSVENMTYWDFITWKQTSNLSMEVSGIALISQASYSKDNGQFNLAIVDSDFNKLTLGSKSISPDNLPKNINGILSLEAMKNHNMKLGDRIRVVVGSVPFFLKIIDTFDFLHPFTYDGNSVISAYVSFLEFNESILSSISLSYIGIQLKNGENKTLITQKISSSINGTVDRVSFDINQKNSLIRVSKFLPDQLFLLNFLGSILLFSYFYILIWMEFVEQSRNVSQLLKFRGFKDSGFEKSFRKLYFLVSIVVTLIANILIIGYEAFSSSLPRIIFLLTKLKILVQNILIQNLIILSLFLINYVLIKISLKGKTLKESA